MYVYIYIYLQFSSSYLGSYHRDKCSFSFHLEIVCDASVWYTVLHVHIITQALKDSKILRFTFHII